MSKKASPPSYTPSYTPYPTVNPHSVEQIAHDDAFNALPTSDSLNQSGCFPLITPRRLIFVSCWVISQATFLIIKIIQGSKDGSASTGYSDAVKYLMMFNISCIFLFMTPTLIGFLRTTVLKKYIDFDKSVHAHKMASYTLVFFIINHVIFQYYKFHQIEVESGGKMKMYNLLFNGTTGRIGHVLICIVVVILLGAIPYVRRRHFEVFYFLHHLHYVVIILIFFHTSNTHFQYFITAPLAIYLADRLYRLYRGFSNSPRILSVIRHPSGVIELRFEKRSIRHKAGQYIYLNVPSISWTQWHPFTLTSAPEEDELSIHIRISGDWTRKLVYMFRQHEDARPRRLQVAHQAISYPPPAKQFKLADDRDSMNALITSPPPEGASGSKQQTHRDQQWQNYAGDNKRPSLPPYYPPGVEHHSLARQNQRMPLPNTKKMLPSIPIYRTCLPTIRVDGPYSAPSQHVFEFETAILISGNIGVTPMSSILKSLYYQLTAARNSPRTIKKMYFIWLCRETQSLEWFKDLLAALDAEEIGDILEIRTYITGQLSVDQIRNISLSQDPNGPDAITGLYRSPTYYGRPNFDKIYEEIGLRNPGSDVGVFYCGSKQLAHHLHKTNTRWNSELSHRGTKFVFHEEKNQS
ncbi:hypothetical protein IW140_003771 [Coemansia sp. RSA 1813]|nr:hypothetical protein EV178_003513 [Coemansia sp. RSA 1646]KAJ1772801.1 hypothetical protein LPJ74_001140 [Coemansia sp. RSA 1843]KAJ2088667.1 hypothetical protein IW138_004049 [Coemansia sp. RSA 986]KAJ2213128.1 hypothetical protein EV179_004098 [Coemansia sp. RSA 487]KAJ2568565.1 hypothetical protein IW140_003771 [Coemansia sp. RSA 1813]